MTALGVDPSFMLNFDSQILYVVISCNKFIANAGFIFSGIPACDIAAEVIVMVTQGHNGSNR